MLVGAAAEVGGGPGRGVRPRHPGLEEEESILHWKAEAAQLAPGLRPCRGLSRDWASLLSRPRLPSWGRKTPWCGQAGPHKLPASLPQPQPRVDVGVPG